MIRHLIKSSVPYYFRAVMMLVLSFSLECLVPIQSHIHGVAVYTCNLFCAHVLVWLC